MPDLDLSLAKSDQALLRRLVEGFQEGEFSIVSSGNGDGGSGSISAAVEVRAAYSAYCASQATTSEYVAVEFSIDELDADQLNLGHAVSLLIRAKSTTQDSLIKVMAKVHSDYPDWFELVSETALTTDVDTEIYADILRYPVIQILIKEGTSGGTVTVAFCAK